MDFFDIAARVLLRDTSVPYMLILCLDNVLWTSMDLIKENGFTLKESKKHDKSWEGAMSTQSSRPLKLVDQFTNLCSNISSTESDVNMHPQRHEMLLAGYRSYENLSIQ